MSAESATGLPGGIPADAATRVDADRALGVCSAMIAKLAGAIGPGS